MNQRKNERRGLGRGLSALMADIGVDARVNDPVVEGQPQRSALQTLPIDAIQANPEQPRRAFDERALEELSRSIQEKGIVQTLVVRPLALVPFHSGKGHSATACRSPPCRPAWQVRDRRW